MALVLISSKILLREMDFNFQQTLCLQEPFSDDYDKMMEIKMKDLYFKMKHK